MVTWRRALLRSWTSWLLRRQEKKHQRLLKQEKLLLLSLDLVRVEQSLTVENLHLLEHRLREMQESEAYRMRAELTPQPQPTGELEQFLGLEQSMPPR